MARKVRTVFLSLLVAVFCAACSGGNEIGEPPLPVTGEVEVAVLSVGKADAIVITTAGKTMVIDAGESDDGGEVLNYLNEKGRSTIDYLIITHYDRDHVGGADRLLNFTTVGEVIRPDYVGEREEYTAFVNSLTELAVPQRVLASGSEDVTFMMEDVEVTVNIPMKTAYTNNDGLQQDNDFSLVVRLRHGAKVFLFAGDCEDARLAELIVSDKNWRADFLKLPYHGNHTELTAAFLARVQPTFAVACDSKKNPMDAQTEAVLAGMNTQTYRTAEGTVRCHSDGVTLTVTQEAE